MRAGEIIGFIDIRSEIIQVPMVVLTASRIPQQLQIADADGRALVHSPEKNFM